MQRFFVFCLLSLSALAHAEEDTIITSDSMLNKANFTLTRGDELIASGLRTGMLPPYRYTLYDMEGTPVIWAHTKVFAAGFFFTCSENLEFYGPEGYLGRMSGTMWTAARGKYTFFDKEDNAVAVAYLGYNKYRFSIVKEEEGKTIKLATIQAQRKKKDDCFLTCTKHPSDYEFDERILYLFGLFAIDFASAADFGIKSDVIVIPQKETHHHYH